jgi:hypothetical protein
MRAYIEIVGSFSTRRTDLYPWNLHAIGKFTRENIQRWLENEAQIIHGPDPLAVDILGDFHAVCGDLDIPWATEKARLAWGCEKPCDECGQEHDWHGIPLGRGRSRICAKCRKEELEY